MNKAFNAKGWIDPAIDDKLEAGGKLEGDEATAWLACSFSNATKNNYPAVALLDRANLDGLYRVTVEKINK